ncbi:rubredoxin [Paraburkholderia dinghuensis]|uniref:Rubredoxin n=1 Tax=Paraburkholderia dinghuensis TaxID=2305225 RepID=A0A3N6PZD3_9BURK|nr:rubredoxin [Paraburkholderia dinghuensis]RQH05326.1 rubredoxin [Paraburkholderia dinghuensis]
MYKKGVALEIQFSPERLNDGAGDPFWIDLTADEAARLLKTLQTQLDAREGGTSAPLVVALDTLSANDADTNLVASDANTTSSGDGFKQWVCVICGWVYDEETGAPDDGLAPGTRWADVPEDWRCPLCDVGKDDFALVEF